MPGKKSERHARIGANIVAARKAKGIGQAELARRIGVESITTMWRYEHGWRTPVDKLDAIARELRVPVGELLRGAPGDEDDSMPLSTATTTTQSEMLRIAQLGLAAAQEGTDLAIQRFEAAVINHADRLRKPPKR